MSNRSTNVIQPESRFHKKRAEHFENASDELWSVLDVLCDVVNDTCTWMDDHALPTLGDNSDGGNSIHTELFAKLCDARDVLMKWGSDPEGLQK